MSWVWTPREDLRGLGNGSARKAKATGARSLQNIPELGVRKGGKQRHHGALACTSRTTSYSSTSARRSMATLLKILLKSAKKISRSDQGL